MIGLEIMRIKQWRKYCVCRSKFGKETKIKQDPLHNGCADSVG